MTTKLKSKKRIYAMTAFSSGAFLLLIVVACFRISSFVDQDTVMFILIGTFLALAISFFLAKRTAKLICQPVDRLHRIMQKVSDGDYEARTGIETEDEFEEIGQAIDNLLHDRSTTLARVEEENERLNDAVLLLLETVARLASKDLTTRAKVNEDITGPIADALNMMASETSKVLNQVMNVSEEVAETSNSVKLQADNVLLLADEEQRQVEETARELQVASDTMLKIGKLADNSSIAAEKAISTTNSAMEAVTNTVDSIDTIKETIHETEKRIKRLGERSQEISTAVNLINNISERTHILALNASMHAASAGEAGRGFAVVADEVQRLAESSKEATAQIGVLVNNIQLESASTVNTMNELISQVVEGSALANEAGEQMRETHSTTTELVSMVEKIIQDTGKQADRSRQLRGRAEVIRDSVRKTGKHLHQQTAYTDKLVEQALALVSSVAVFKLTEGDAETFLDIEIDSDSEMDSQQDGTMLNISI